MRKLTMTLMLATALASGSALAMPGDVATISGGVGQSDRAMIEAQQNNYSNKIVFTGKGGMFVSDVHVTISDKAGNPVVSTVTNGPILLTDLPAGTYKVNAVANGIEKNFTVTAGSRGLRTTQITFPISDNPELSNADGTYLPKAPSSMGYYQPYHE